MNEKVDIIALYQQEHLGLKRIAKITGLSPSGVRKRLRAAGVYLGTRHREENHKKMLDICDLGHWQTEGSATVRPVEGGICLYLPDAFSVGSYRLPKRAGKKIRLHVRLSPAGALFGDVRFGLRSGENESGGTAYLQGGQIPLSEWVTELTCRGVPEVFFQGGVSPGGSEFFLAEAWIGP
jgi:hypothetical protein